MRILRLVLVLLLCCLLSPQTQHVNNPPSCPVCHTQVNAEPVKLLVMGDNDTIDGSSLSLPVFVCPKDGLLFAVQP